MNTNILITSAGKRVELLKEFQKELKNLFPEGHIFAVDMNPIMSPACHIADEAFTVPAVRDPNYPDYLLEICKKHNVGIVIPTIDTELAILALNKEKFEQHGINVMASDAKFISICRDKRLTIRLFEELGIKNPRSIDINNPVFPIFAKPYDGSLSTNIHILRNPQDLTDEILNDPKLLFMELIDKKDYKEFTVDMYYGKDSKVKFIVPRERIEIRSGEINKGITRKNKIVDFLKEKMGSLPGVRGCICVQLFFRESDGDVIGIEINPRYGGGYPLSYYAGANFPAMMIEEYLMNKSFDYSDNWRDNTVMLRYDSQVIFNE